MPLQLPTQTAQQQRKHYMPGPCKPADDQHTAGKNPDPRLHPAHVQHSACISGRHAHEASIADLRSHATRPDQFWQRQQGPMADPDTVTSSSAQPADNCPQVQFGVFTNLTSGTTFTKPGKLSKAAQKKMHELAASFRQDGLLDQGTEAGSMQQPAMNNRNKDQSALAGQGCHADIQQNTHTVVNSRHGSHPDQLASAAQKQTAPVSNSDASAEGIIKPDLSAQLQQGHRQAEPADCGSVQPAGSCPQVQFGVFTNLTNGNSFTKPGKLSKAAQQKMQALQASLRQEGMLEDLPGPLLMGQAALQEDKQNTTASQGLQARHDASYQRVEEQTQGRDNMTSNQLSELPQLQGAADKWADVSAKHEARHTSSDVGVHQSSSQPPEGFFWDCMSLSLLHGDMPVSKARRQYHVFVQFPLQLALGTSWGMFSPGLLLPDFMCRPCI